MCARMTARCAIALTFSLFALLGVSSFAPLAANTKVARSSVREGTSLFADAALTPEEKRLKKLRISYGEESRKYRRSYFTHDEWLKHRSRDRLTGTFVKIFQSGFIRTLRNQVGIVTTIAIILVLYNHLLVLGWTDINGIKHDPLAHGLPMLKLPTEPFALVSPVLSLLLVFRTNVCWTRWDEASKAWGVIVNHSRNLLRQGCSWVSEETEPDPETRREALEFFCNSVWALARSEQRHLWGFHEDDVAFQREVRAKLDPFEAEGLIAARHKPTRANNDLTRAINELPITYLRRIEMDKSAIAFADAMGSCDRLFTSPVPLFYTRHAARFVGIYMMAMPFGLWSAFDTTCDHFLLIPAVALFAFFLFGTEELAIQLEEPFSLLPLSTISAGIGLSAKEHLDWYYEHENDAKSENMYVSKQRIFE